VRVVVDTNVLVSGLLSLRGPPAQIVDLVVAGALWVLFDEWVLDEYDAVLRRPRFGFDAADVDALRSDGPT
jgi:putative PIN family toxin of toxin-antitoxin system